VVECSTGKVDRNHGYHGQVGKCKRLKEKKWEGLLLGRQQDPNPCSHGWSKLPVPPNDFCFSFCFGENLVGSFFFL